MTLDSMVATDAQHLAQRTIQAWHQLLVVNSHKTAFNVTDKIIHKELSKLLSPRDPPIQTVMRDLGIDHSAGRRRRIATLQQRFRKNKQRRIKLRSLKLPNLRTRLRLHRGGVQPVAFWGFEGQGLAPRYRLALRQGLAVHLGLHQGGLQDVIYDQVSNKFGDPGDQVVIHHIRALPSSPIGPQTIHSTSSKPGSHSETRCTNTSIPGIT